MSDEHPNRRAPAPPARADDPREARLKAALKANMARRKAQAKARGGAARAQTDQTKDE
jgi:hypothetical protein